MGLPNLVLLGIFADRADGVGGGHPVEEAGIDRDAALGEGAIDRRRGAVGRRGHDGNFEAVFLGEGEVAFVLAGGGHDRAGAIAHQDVVGDPDRDVLIGEEVARIGAGEDAGLFLDGREPLDFGLLARLRDVFVDCAALRIGGDRGDQRMLGREDHERNAEDRIGAGGEEAHLVAGMRGDREGDFGALGTADPVALHQLDGLGPIDAVEIGEKAIGVVGDFEEPLLEVFFADRGIGVTPAAAVDDLLVGEDGAAFFAPPLGAHRAVGEAALEEHQEEPLGPAVVLGRGGIDLAGPVVGASGQLQLALEVGGIAGNGFLGMEALQEGVVFGGQAERVPAHRMEDVEARHPLVATDDVAGDVVVEMADGEAVAGRIGEHFEDVEFRARGILASEVEVGALPFVTPLGLDSFRVVTLVHRTKV